MKTKDVMFNEDGFQSISFSMYINYDIVLVLVV